MASRVVMPQMTDVMDEGVVVSWKKREGERVAAGEALAEIETDKAVMDLEAPASGTVRWLLAQEGETVRAGSLIAVIGAPDEDISQVFENSAAPGAPPKGAKTVTQGAEDRPLSQMRKAIARAMTQSKAPVPHFYLTAEIAMDAAEALRLQLKQGRKEHPVPSTTALIVKAAALALIRHPEINVSFLGDAIRQHRTIDIGIAVGLDDGLLTPVLRDCGGKSLEDIAAETRRLIERARARKLHPQEYTGATFSISNLGMFEVENFIAVLMPPEAAALAVGAIREVPVVEKGRVTSGRRMNVTLSCDHRALDGVQAARFLREIKRILEHPAELTAERDKR
jgi:pyruvate dehydrogenase E2 component (dihydrolipoamide acetyltransferase)